ncbi:MAG: hypothetical protein ACOX87_02485 [Chloroflexota bacterium]
MASYLTPPQDKAAASHTDAISLNSSIWLDGEPFTDRGKVVHRDLAGFAEALLKG